MAAPRASRALPSVCMVGAGEYNTGYVPTATGTAPDKPAGVVGITLFDMRRRGLVGRILLADAVGVKLPAVRANMQVKIGDAYRGMDLALESFPADDVAFDATAYELAFATMSRGDSVIIFTPDDTHAAIARAAIARGLHVLVAKPLVKTLAEHAELTAAAAAAGVLLCVEYHKRWDPIYSDFVSRARGLGPFSYFYSAMTQRREQLDTFAGWAGKSSDISYYLNSHHIDVHAWAVRGRARPIRVTGCASVGIAAARLARPGVEDTISLLAQWENVTASAAAGAAAGAATGAAASSAPAPAPAAAGGALSLGHAVYMASWVAPTADCHTQQAFHYMGAKGEARADQAHRGYSLSADADAGGTGALATLNPLYMRYTPDSRGFFAGQSGYGYRSIEAFVAAAAAIAAGETTAAEVSAGGDLATAAATLQVTAILEAGRRSLDAGGAPIAILYDDAVDALAPCGLARL